ncbi:1381_t:CDS:1, partial [Racocetra persica]
LLKLEQKPNKDKQEKSLAIKLITLTSLLDKFKNTYDDYYLPSIVVYIAINEYLKEKFEPENPLRKEIKKFLVSKANKEEDWKFHDRIVKFHHELNTKILKKLIF